MERLHRLVSARRDIRFAPAEHDVWELELKRPPKYLPSLELPDAEAMLHLIAYPDSPGLEEQLAGMKAAKDRFKAMHLRSRRELSRRFKALNLGAVSAFERSFVRETPKSG